MTRRFVLVSAAYVDHDHVQRFASGIRKLKRGVHLRQFVLDFLAERSLDEDAVRIYNRQGSLVAVWIWQSGVGYDSQRSISWTFTEYPDDELFSAVAHLSKEELLRDLKELLPLRLP